MWIYTKKAKMIFLVTMFLLTLMSTQVHAEDKVIFDVSQGAWVQNHVFCDSISVAPGTKKMEVSGITTTFEYSNFPATVEFKTLTHFSFSNYTDRFIAKWSLCKETTTGPVWIMNVPASVLNQEIRNQAYYGANFWKFTADSPGVYSIRIYVNDRLVGIYPFFIDKTEF